MSHVLPRHASEAELLNYSDSMRRDRYFGGRKGPEWNPLLFAHPSGLYNREPKGCVDQCCHVINGSC